jgi:putative peptide zinc metalloprotease protein
VPRLAEGVEVLGRLDGSGYRDAPTLVRRGDGQTLQVTPMLANLIDLLDGQRDTVQLARLLSQRVGKAATADDVGYLIENKLAPLGVLYDADDAAPAPIKANPLLALRFKVVASNPAVTRRITAPFAWLFHSAVVIPVLVAFAFVCWWVLADKGLASATRSAFYDPPLLLAVLGLTVLSAGLHEFGHAAACRYGGATPGAMGAGIYIVWPAFYTDVDDSYRLSRWGRLRVDLGGLYFNALIAVAITAWWWVTRQDALLLGVATQLLQMLRQLAPYIRADGYHILADLTGVPDLFSHMKPTMLALLPWRWGRPAATPLKRWARVVVSAWVLLVVPMLLAMFAAGVLLLPRLVATAWDSGRLQLAQMQTALGDGDITSVLARGFSLVALVLPVAAISFLVIRFVRSLHTRAWRSTEGRPVARGAMAAVTVVVLALMMLAWWPAGQYEPVHASEKGTLQTLLADPEPVRAAPAGAPAGVQPQTALALVPRVDGYPTLLLTEDDDSLRTIVTGGDGEQAEPGTAFPFRLPDAPGEGDNQALAVNETDGSVEYDVAVALVWVTDGDAALNTNEAYALASCTGCTTVAVAFQVVLVVDQTDVVAPTNAAVAGNMDCIACSTAALAVQLVVTLNEMPDDEVQAKIDAAMAELDGLDELTATLDLGAVYTQIKAVEQEILDILVTAGLVDAVLQEESTASASPSAESSASPEPEPSASTDPSTSPAPSASSSEAASSSPTPDASPSEPSSSPS